MAGLTITGLDSFDKLSKGFLNVKTTLSNRNTWSQYYKLVFRNLVLSMKEHFKGLPSITEETLKWKRWAIKKGYKVKTPYGGMPVRYTAVGRRTGLAYRSLTTQSRQFANIWQENVGGVPGRWIFGISTSKSDSKAAGGKGLPYFAHFSKDRPVVYLDYYVGEIITDALGDVIDNAIEKEPFLRQFYRR